MTMRRWIAVPLLSVAIGSFAPALGAGASPTLPRGWKVVTHRGVGIDVPATWTVQPWHGCGVSWPTVLIGPAKPTEASCSSANDSVAVVVLGSLPWAANHTWHHTTLNGLRATVTTQQVSATSGAATPGPLLTSIHVRLPSKGMTISIRVGDSSASPGGAPGRAERILVTIHAVGR